MKLYENPLYMEDINYVKDFDLPWEKLKDKSVLITGGTGLIGSFLVDVLLEKDINIDVYILGRSEEKAKDRFSKYLNLKNFHFVKYDVNDEIKLEIKNIDYILHLASNTHPIKYSTEPISTITTNIIGLNNLLSFASTKETKRILFASSVEIYGENRGDVEKFDESYLGYINSNTMRAGYPESKRCSESLCQAYIKEKGLDIVIPRLCRVYGPTLLKDDSKALSQFIFKGVKGEDIILKSEGNQFYSYLYVSDMALALLYILLNGKCGEAYNIADSNSDITLKDLTKIISNYSNKDVIFELPSEKERAGYSTATKAILDSTKLNNLGWNAKYSIKEGLIRTIEILKEVD